MHFYIITFYFILITIFKFKYKKNCIPCGALNTGKLTARVTY